MLSWRSSTTAVNTVVASGGRTRWSLSSCVTPPVGIALTEGVRTP